MLMFEVNHSIGKTTDSLPEVKEFEQLALSMVFSKKLSEN